MSGPYVLAPITITDAMVTSSTIAEPASGEALWNAATNYTLGTEVILVSTHRVYENLIPGVDATSPNLSVGSRWLDKRPTQKWAALDQYVSTQSQIVTPMTYVFRPGIFNAFAAYGLEGGTLTISIKNAPAGAVFFTQSIDLSEPPIDHYDYYFGRIKSLSKLLIRNIVPYADPEVTLSITAGAGVTVKSSMFIFGDLRNVIAVEGTGGVQYGAQAKPTTNSLFIADGFGGTKIVQRTKGTDMDITAFMQQADADAALATLQDVLDVPAAWIGTDLAGYAGLNVFGIASGSVNYAGPAHAILTASVKGLF